jgi:hypothetical protein
MATEKLAASLRRLDDGRLRWKACSVVMFSANMKAFSVATVVHSDRRLFDRLRAVFRNLTSLVDEQYISNT